jgi:hypothetical protein
MGLLTGHYIVVIARPAGEVRDSIEDISRRHQQSQSTDELPNAKE